jgi:class 3 adenylate cyclase
MNNFSSDGQRRQVTVLFADMVDFTPTSEKLGEEAIYTLMRRVIAEMSEAVTNNNGSVQNLTGDGMMALFGAPVAIEDAPLRACQAALDIQTGMQALENELEARYGVRPKFRIGLNTGPIVIGRMGDDDKAEITALGDTVNLAARLEGEAESGGIVLSQATHQLVDGYADSSFAGEREIKGKTGKLPVYVLNGLKESVSRFDLSVTRGLTPLVGRGPELESLQRLWDDCRTGALRVVNIVGEAGLGKSRLVHDFHQRLADEKIFFLQGRCSSSGTATPFLPFIDVVRGSFGINADTPRTDVEQRLTRGLELLGIPPDETLPYLLNLLGQSANDDAVKLIDSEVIGVRTRNALLSLLRERRRVSPVVMFIDDLHWMDSASQELLVKIASEDADLPLLLICAYRPEYEAPWVSLDGALDIRLDQLSRDGSLELIKKRFNTEAVPTGLVQLIGDRAEGNPLFAEEIINYLLEKGQIENGETGLIFHESSGADLPVTIENLLMDRVDRMTPGARSILEAAAVIGMAFSEDLIASVTGIDGGALGHLEEMQDKDLVVFDPSQNSYRIKHALVREAVYKSILGSTREKLHENIAGFLEVSGSEIDGDLTNILAWHYGQTSNDGKAVRFMARAGEQSLMVYSLDEAESHFRDAIQRIERSPGCVDDTELLDILLHLSRVLYFRIDFYGIIALVESYQPVFERVADPHRLGRFLFETGYAHVFSGQHEIGKPILDRAHKIAEETQDDEIVGYASLGLMFYYAYWTEPTTENGELAMDYSANAFRIAETINDGWLAAKSLLGPPLYFANIGKPGESRRRAMRLIEFGRTSNDPRPRTMGLWALAIINSMYFEFEEAISNADESLAAGLCPIDQICARTGKSIAQLSLGQTDEALNAMDDIHAKVSDGGLVILQSISEYTYGLAKLFSGDLAEGVAWIEDWHKQAERLKYHLTEGFYNLYMGEINLEMAIGDEKPPPAVMRRNLWFLLKTLPFAASKARRHLESSVAYFRKYEMPAHLSRSLMNLARLQVAKKQYGKAQVSLDEARSFAEMAEEQALAHRIDAIAAALPAR